MIEHWPDGHYLLDWSAYSRVLLAAQRRDSGRRLPPESLSEFTDMVREDRLHVCQPFRFEARYSARTAADFTAQSAELDGFHQADGNAVTWEIASRAQEELAASPAVNHRVKPIDLLIAAIATQHGVGVLHYDADYDRIAEHSGLSFESRWIASRGLVD